jgi:methanogenic corrinoid protein MtbC1/DNA-binding XRE family transcriptional regulator
MTRRVPLRRPSFDSESFSRRYLESVRRGDRAEVDRLVGEAIEAGGDPLSVLVDGVAAAQKRIGDLWRNRELSIAVEHAATELSREQVERICLAFPPKRPTKGSVVVLAAPGELHVLPARILAVLLAWRGWRVDFLGEGPPQQDLLRFVRERRPDLVALSVTRAKNLEALRSTCRALKGLEPPPRILLGGSAVAGKSPEALGVDAVASDARQGLDLAEGLVGAAPRRDLSDYLATVGRRIRERRLELGRSQAELASLAGLGRPYLVAVERGRQNITLEAAMKIAGALGISMGELLGD